MWPVGQQSPSALPPVPLAAANHYDRLLPLHFIVSMPPRLGDGHFPFYSTLPGTRAGQTFNLIIVVLPVWGEHLPFSRAAHVTNCLPIITANMAATTNAVPAVSYWFYSNAFFYPVINFSTNCWYCCCRCCFPHLCTSIAISSMQMICWEQNQLTIARLQFIFWRVLTCSDLRESLRCLLWLLTMILQQYRSQSMMTSMNLCVA